MRAEATKGSSKDTKNLFAPDAEDAATPANAQGIWCQITTKKHIAEEKRLKPTRIPIPHTLNLGEATSICVITPDPQRAFKEVLSQPDFPAELGAQIRILGLTKLKQRYKSFEARRQLRSQYDVFLADDRVITMLPRLLGKIFYENSKRPMPVRLEAPRPKDPAGKPLKQSVGKKDPDAKISVAGASSFAREIQQALTSARVHLAPSTSTSVHIGYSSFSPEHAAANITALLDGLVAKHVIPQGWRNIRAVHVKGPTTAALPIYLADQLWLDETDVIEDQEAAELARQRERRAGAKRKDRALEQDAAQNKRIRAASEDDDLDFSPDMAARREALRLAKHEARALATERESVAVKKSVVNKARRDAGAAVPSEVVAAPG